MNSILGSCESLRGFKSDASAERIGCKKNGSIAVRIDDLPSASIDKGIEVKGRSEHLRPIRIVDQNEMNTSGK